MSIVNKFPVRDGVLMNGKSSEYDLGDQPGRSGLGILLSRSDTAGNWLDVAYGEGRLDVSLNITERGISFVTERIKLPTGEGRVFGKADRPWMSEYVSRVHVGITAVKYGVIVADLDSTNGSSVWVSSVLDEGDYREDANPPFDQGDVRGNASSSPEIVEVETLKERHGAEFPDLEQVDYGILSTMIKSYPGTFNSRREKLKIVALIHPDRNITGDAKRSHQLYILALKVLDIQL